MDRADLINGRVARAHYDFADAADGAASRRAYWTALETTFTTLAVTAGEGFLRECFPASAYPAVGSGVGVGVGSGVAWVGALWGGGGGGGLGWLEWVR